LLAAQRLEKIYSWGEALTDTIPKVSSDPPSLDIVKDKRLLLAPQHPSMGGKGIGGHPTSRCPREDLLQTFLHPNPMSFWITLVVNLGITVAIIPPNHMRHRIPKGDGGKEGGARIISETGVRRPGRAKIQGALAINFCGAISLIVPSNVNQRPRSRQGRVLGQSGSAGEAQVR